MASPTTAGAAAQRRVRLHCLAHAGAGVASYRRWPLAAGPAVEVAALPLPGRGARRREPRVTDRSGLLADLLGPLREAARAGPYALYGHSLGALVAYTLTRALADEGAPAPLFLAVGACLPPHATAALMSAAEAPDEHLLPLLADLGSLPKGAAARPGGLWRRSVLPVLRDDLRLAKALRQAAMDPATGGPVNVPLLVFAGSDDPLAVPHALHEWRQWTTGPITARTLAGDHFFAGDDALPALIGAACREHAAAAPSTPAPSTPAPRTSGAATPAPGTSGAATPGPGTPGPATPPPPTPAPATSAPGTSGSGTPGAATPGRATPAPGTPALPTSGPDAPGPATSGPGAPGAATPAPSTLAPGTPAPPTSGPGTPGPATSGPGAPGPATPAPATPGAATPAPGKPVPPTPGPGTPGPGTPGAATSGSGACGAGPGGVRAAGGAR
ncbi:thioesterase domain-containing protein [Streptomyces sp. NPDC046985]|uniref:thioesterase II family protein n=1 Tax=Streptomyces sp. NPDC046985 TaxID=3155377 RepID=UPI0033FB9A3A